MDTTPNKLDPNAQAAAAGKTPDYLALPRAGLQELLDLSATAIAPVELEIEQRFQQACASAESILQTTVTDTETRTQERLTAAESAYTTQIAQVQAEFETATAELAADTRRAIARIDANTHELETEVRHQMDDKLLLADTVAQAAAERLRRESQVAEQHVAEGHQRLEALQQRALVLLERYGVAVPSALARPESDAPLADPLATYQQQAQVAAEYLDAIGRLVAPRLFFGARPYLILVLLCALVVGMFGALSFFEVANAPPFGVSGPISLIITFVLAVPVGLVIRHTTRARIEDLYASLAQATAFAGCALDQHVVKTRAREKRNAALAADLERNNPERLAVRRHFENLLAEARRRDAESRARVDEAHRQQQAAIEQRREVALRDAAAHAELRTAELRQRCENVVTAARATHARTLEECRARYVAERTELRTRWRAGLERLQRFVAMGDELGGSRCTNWVCDAAPGQSSPDEYAALIPFGHWLVDFTRLAPGVRELARFLVGRQQTEATPALLAVPGRCSLLLQTGRAGRQQAIDTLRVVMLRLLMTLRPGRVRFTIIDPVGLGESFAGFMHLVDYEEALVGGRIWTESEHIEARLTELTSHMENVIQKYLRNEFATIDAYNRQAGQLAEPYRFLVIADFPANFSDGAAHRLGSIISSGARCGVFTLIAHDQRLGLPTGLPLEDLAGKSLHLVHNGERFVAQDELLQQFPLLLDAPPSENTLTRIMHAVGQGARDALRVEVPFDAIVPTAGQQWQRAADAELNIPIGHAGAVRLQLFRLGRGLAQHALVAGKTGSGKSTLLHVIITNLALWYNPDEVELYLVDFKKGVEFKTYVTHELPHARAVAIESDREFGVSVLQRLDAEMIRRGELFRAAGVQDLPAYRAAAGNRLPRTLLIVDEFQVFFTEDDKLAQDAGVLLDRLVRQGRAFGIHVLLGSQTLGGSSGLGRSTIGQMAVRIALQCSEADSQLILDDTNVAARLLSRPGEAIYNDAGGLVAGNSVFQVAWLPDERQSHYLKEVRAMAGTHGHRGEPPIVFEGNAPADVRQNHRLTQLIEARQWPAAVAEPSIWLGEPVAIKDPTGVTVRRQSGANLLIIGQRDDAALAMMAAVVLCLGSQHAPHTARFVILGGAATDGPASGGLRLASKALPHAVQWVDWSDVPTAIAELAAETQRRLTESPGDAPTVYLLIYGLQRYRVLRRREDAFSFSSAAEDSMPATDRQFAELLREGPPLGLHTLIWSDTLATLERTLERQSLREFDNRVLFQMSAADSSNLIDTPEANRLGLYRALLFSEERGLLEKFRPYGPPDAGWLMHIQERLTRRSASV